MPASAIDRFSNNTGHNGVFTGPVVNQTLPNKRNEMMERISRQCFRLRQQIGVNGVVDLTKQGRNDSLEQLLVRLGTIPIVVFPNTTSLQGTLQCWAARRPAASEQVSVAGPTAAATFISTDAAKNAAFTAGGANQVLTATEPVVDTAAKGRALITITP